MISMQKEGKTMNMDKIRNVPAMIAAVLLAVLILGGTLRLLNIVLYRAGRIGMLAAVLETEHARTHRLPAAARLPELGRLEDRHENLLRARTIHLLAHDALDLVERTQPERQKRIESARELLDEPGAHQQLVRIDFGVPRIFPEGVDHHLCPAHINVLFLRCRRMS